MKKNSEQEPGKKIFDKELGEQIALLLALSLIVLSGYDMFKITAKPALKGLAELEEKALDLVFPTENTIKPQEASQTWVMPEQEALIKLSDEDIGRFAIIYLPVQDTKDAIGIRLGYRAIVQIRELKEIKAINQTIKAFEGTVVNPNLDGTYSWGKTNVFWETNIERLIDPGDSHLLFDNFKN